MVDSGRKVFPWHRFLFLKIFVIKFLQGTASNFQACPPTACIILLDFLFDFFGICQGQLFAFSLINCFATFTAFLQCHLSHLTCRLKSSRNKVHGFQRIIFAWGCHNNLQRIVIGSILRKVKMICMQKNVSSLKLIKKTIIYDNVIQSTTVLALGFLQAWFHRLLWVLRHWMLNQRFVKILT